MIGPRSRRRLVDASGLLALELVGTRYGSLKIISRKTEDSASNLLVEVQCERCDGSHMSRFHNIRKRPNTAACPHCNGRTPVTVPHWLYVRCQSQKDRCQNPRSDCYDRYGGRGIEFRFASVNAAATWVAENLGIADRSMELDREDNLGHYESGNLRWVTSVENMSNRRCNRGAREQFISFRACYPEVRYADRTLMRLIHLGMTDEQIIEKWKSPSCKPKGKYGTFSALGLYRDSRPTVG